MSEAPIRVLIAKPGLDGHDRGARVVARALRDAGMEVIYTGIRQTPAAIVQAVIDEDVDVLGMSSLSGGHAHLFPAVLQGLAEAGVNDVVVIGGGIIPPEDVEALKAQGMEAIFGPGTPTEEIVSYIRDAVERRRLQRARP